MFLRHNVLGLSWAIFVFVLSALPGGQFKDATYPHADKILHVILYGVLFLLLLVGFIKQRTFSWLRDKPKIKVFIIVVGYGVLLEILQDLLFEQRSIELEDMLANAAGAALGWGVFRAIYGTEKYT